MLQIQYCELKTTVILNNREPVDLYRKTRGNAMKMRKSRAEAHHDLVAESRSGGI